MQLFTAGRGRGILGGEAPSLTWASHIDIHAIGIHIALRGCQRHGRRHTDVCSNQVVLGPLAAIHSILGPHTGLLYLEAQGPRLSQGFERDTVRGTV